ncbi:M61 family metallopeptidase [Spirulina sp. 06S082]|uniref:M61 family metallopeptidase n=1 Tax=Spirulina sp. 06S082 TaxID=3110248 RepID=UPI002B21F977|nr:M61 family metallopeptidase [Spirulina sp. 06S082]MEA5468220.1 M61 family metallopeptidase [Spirulina sp. 06S082]
MTKATVLRDRTSTTTAPTLSYCVALPEPQNHLFEVTLKVENWRSDRLNLQMPVWTPGSYLVREYSRHVQDFKATTGNEKQSLHVRKLEKNHWQIDTEDTTSITVYYRIYANELTVRTNHLDRTHGYFNGASLFFFIPSWENNPYQIAIALPHPDWHVTTSLPKVEGQENTFIAENFDVLVDSPFEIGQQIIYNFEVLGKSHQWAIWGEGNLHRDRLIEDTKKIIKTEAKLYGNLPYDEYIFLLHLNNDGFGGLEHKNCCSLIYDRFGFRNKERYNRFLQLVAHEFFHLWNVKRIRPKALETFDYTRENYTTSLWFCEGATSYYDTIIPLWAKVYDRKTFFDTINKDITRYLQTPGRNVQSLSESSFDAWIKLYRRHPNSDNSQISYYLKGEMVSFLLDLRIRRKYKNERSLNDVMQIMWEKFGQEEIGYTPQQLQAVIESVAEEDLSDFFHKYLQEMGKLPFNEYLLPFGLKIESVLEKNPYPYLGIKTVIEEQKTKIQFVWDHSPAAKVGIDIGDELLAIDGIRVTHDNLNERLRDYQAGDAIALTVFHQEILQTYQVILDEPEPIRYQIVQIKSSTSAAKELLEGWLNS